MFGSLFEIISTSVYFTIYYYKKPKTIENTTDVLEIDSSFENAIKHYVQGHALRNDKDTKSRVLGNEELSLYKEELKEIKKVSGRDYSTQNGHEIAYRRI